MDFSHCPRRIGLTFREPCHAVITILASNKRTIGAGPENGVRGWLGKIPVFPGTVHTTIKSTILCGNDDECIRPLRDSSLLSFYVYPN